MFYVYLDTQSAVFRQVRFYYRKTCTSTETVLHSYMQTWRMSCQNCSLFFLHCVFFPTDTYIFWRSYRSILNNIAWQLITASMERRTVLQDGKYASVVECLKYSCMQSEFLFFIWLKTIKVLHVNIVRSGCTKIMKK